MGRVPESSIQEIRSRVDIVGLIGRYVELRRAGRNWTGLCPFHSEKTPSFNVNPDRQIFHCFGCQEGGDAISFVMKHEGLAFREAVGNLAAECGVEIEDDSPGQAGERGLADKLSAANDVAQALYRESLEAEEGRRARDYLKGRGFTDEAIAEYAIGYAPDRWDAVATRLERAGIAAGIGEKAGLLAKRERQPGYYDRLRGRVTFPIRDVRGRVVGFGGRALAEGQEPKYLNTPETPLFRKRETFYGFPDALSKLREADRAIVCEGYFDRIALSRAGLGEALATCGTALTPEHAKQLKKRRTSSIVLLFDGDKAGRQALERSLQTLLPEGLRIRAVSLPSGEDPDSFLVRHGVEKLRKLVDQSQDAVELVIQWAVDVGCTTPGQKADVVNRIVPLLALIDDSVERVEYARRLAIWTATDEQAVQAAVRKGAQGVSADVVDAIVAPRRASPEERHLHELAVLLFRHPDLAGSLDREVVKSLLPAGSWLAVISALLEAADSESLDASGAADVFMLADRMDEDARARLRAVAVEEDLFRGDTKPEQALQDIVRALEKRQIDALQKELTRRMGDPEADHAALLEQKTKLREQGLAFVRNGDGPGTRL